MRWENRFDSDTDTSSPSSEDSGEYTSSSPSSSAPSSSPSYVASLASGFKKELNSRHSRRSYVRLPEPFFPPSLAHLDETAGDLVIRPRALPSDLGLPRIPQEEACNTVNSQDIGTPDDWVPRDPRLVRLTGKHPFNSEAKLKDLYAAGFLTPSNLFYVRNHGAVPKVCTDEWKLEIHGLCSNPVVLTLDDLRTKFQVVTIPVTLVCAGNRRKEQNVVQKSLGFNWGAGGLSTALFTGVYVSDVLRYVRPTRKARHVIFEGCDKLPNGPYGTSQPLSWARDKGKGMLLSWAMNGLALEPDHGFPLRLVVPSQIGGRSVKWLTRMELSSIESQHHLHFHDNKVLPTSLGPEQARAEKKWWYDPRYIIYELNTNSAIACPDHDEIVETASPASESYTLRGYAYAGGGRRVTRVGVSFDDGDTWCLADITYPEDLFRTVVRSDPVYGKLDLTGSDKCFCWCFWSFEAPFEILKKSDAIMVRCMDDSMALQPRDMYWNATGMMNNWWFRVCIHKLDGDRLRFEHPTMAGVHPGGWMQRMKDEGKDITKPVFSADRPSDLVLKTDTTKLSSKVSMTKPGIDRKISIAELEAHNTADQPWFVVKGEVYDGTGFLNQHPGGSQSITIVAGEDATEDFMAIHSSDARRQLADFHIGTLVGERASGEVDDNESGPFLNQKRWKKVVLVSVKDVSSDSKIFRFALPQRDQDLGLPVGQHVYVRLRRKRTQHEVSDDFEGELVQRAYTPVSRQGHRGFVDFLIKIYRPSDQYPEGGRMTLGFAELVIGDFVELKGPIGDFVWQGRGSALLHGKERRIREIGMVCGGSGITPVLQVLRAILHDSSYCDTLVWVLDVNRYLGDILCREELDQLVKEHRSRYRLHYTLTGNCVPDDWKYSTGRINEEMLRAHLPAPAKDGMVCICGPPQMEHVTKDTLIKLGWDPSTEVHIF